ncbi:hypothetical protein LLEC1_07578 [Akanthomyces lecanii]|uniref:RCC1-like domain-containing protein n=1 Tax=Cordyceps confragosa TaxID=2714763 RepID=A0A179IAB6_CORDF|nr:hypothetical protein LLEC1_07578 [Akanthomyces lecanii]
MATTHRAQNTNSRKGAAQKTIASSASTASKKPNSKKTTGKLNGRGYSETPVPTVAARKRKQTPSGTHDDQGSAKLAQHSQPTKRTKTSHVKGREATPDVINHRATEAVNVFMFGGGENGELGLGPKQTAAARPRKNPFLDPSQSSALHVTDIACGGMHTIALTVDNKIVTWGVNDNEALGRNTDWDGGMRDVDDESDDEDGELNPFESTPMVIPSEYLGKGDTLVSVAAGDSCSFALTSTGLVYGWGTFRDPEGKESFGYSADGAVVKKQATPMLIQGLEKIMQIACGANHALALDNHGNIWGWGSGHQNQFGRRLFGRHQDTLKPQIVRVCRGKAKYIACGEYHCFAIDQSDNVWGWGLNSYGEAGDAKTAGSDSAVLPQPIKIPALCGKGVTLLAGGAHHSAAVTSTGDCLVWGRIDGGQLGIKFSAEQIADERQIRCDERGKPRICLEPTVISTVGSVSHVACGTDHTLFISKEGHAFSSGFGSEGQLGLGTDDDAEIAQKIEGKQVKEQFLTWAGAGGQFSVVTGKAS